MPLLAASPRRSVLRGVGRLLHTVVLVGVVAVGRGSILVLHFLNLVII